MTDFGQHLGKRMDAGREAANFKELAYMRKRPIYGKSVRSTNSRAVTSKNHHRQSNYQLPSNDNKSLDFVYYSDSEDEQDGKISHIICTMICIKNETIER